MISKLSLFHVYVCSLFNDAVTQTINILSNLKMKLNNQLQRMWKKVVMPKFKVLSQHLSERIKESHKKIVRIVGFPAEIRNGHPWNMSNKRYPLNHLAY